MEVVGEQERSSPSPAASPEFEFWMVGKNPAPFQSPELLTADELFSDGIVLPLRTLQQAPESADGDGGGVEASALAEEVEVEAGQRLAESGPAPTPDLPAVTFKWKDIFKATGGGGESKDRKKMERRVSSVGGNGELININIWPFSRSRSAGHSAGAGAGALSRNKSNPNANANANASTAPAAAAAPVAAAAPGPARKVSSAPCSRSNSRGETSAAAPAPAPASIAAAAACAAAATAPAAPTPPSAPVPATSMLRRLVPGQGRTGLTVTGIRLGRASPVWQLRRNKLQQQGAAAEQKQSTNDTGAATKKKPTTDAATTTQEVDGDDNATPTQSVSTATAPAPATTGCRNNASCSEAGGEEVNPPQGLFGLRTLFSKKVY
ncbi:translation initiation factor IF-2 [Oryza brachyantha]|uniref:translation initiation factor IF-2 n=1 Tax=Oryza brachyantha TaxID=4533 RepID=UPI001ADB5A8E|nr:translation initiation factor IF-2 [Oryza brachyantha]